MACSNFCTPRDLDELNYYTRDITSEQEREYQETQKADAMREVHMAASTAGADVFGNTVDAQLTTALVAGALTASVIATWAQGLAEAISITYAAKQASEM